MYLDTPTNEDLIRRMELIKAYKLKDTITSKDYDAITVIVPRMMQSMKLTDLSDLVLYRSLATTLESVDWAAKSPDDPEVFISILKDKAVKSALSFMCREHPHLFK